jgi:hypothetical protein
MSPPFALNPSPPFALSLSKRWALVCLAACAAGCGYKFTAGGAALPEGLGSVCAPVFSNHTAEPGLELVFTQALRARLIHLGASRGPCDGELRGEVLAVSGAPTVVSSKGQLASYRVVATLRLRLYRGERLLGETDVSGAEDYLPALDAYGDVLRVEANRQAALRRLAEALAREGYERLAAAW